MYVSAEDPRYAGFVEMIARALGVEPDGVPYFLTPAQVAVVIGETEATVRRGINEGRIVADKTNGRWKVCRDTLLPNTREAFRNDEVMLG